MRSFALAPLLIVLACTKPNEVGPVAPTAASADAGATSLATSATTSIAPA